MIAKYLYRVTIYLFCICTLLLIQCSKDDNNEQIEATEEVTIIEIDPLQDGNNDGFYEWVMQDTLITEGSLYGSDNSVTIDLDNNDIDDIIINLHTAEKFSLSTGSIKKINEDVSFAINEYQDSLFQCDSYLNGSVYFVQKYNNTSLVTCDTSSQDFNIIDITNRVKVESYTDLDTTLFDILDTETDSVEMFYTYYLYRSNFSENLRRGDFMEEGDKYVYFNTIQENETKKAYLKLRAEPYKIILLEKGVEK